MHIMLNINFFFTTKLMNKLPIIDFRFYHGDKRWHVESIHVSF